MAETVLLIQPPHGRILEIPFGAVPALTAALRSEGIPTLQRDLSVELFLQLLDPNVTNMLIRRIDAKIAALRASWKCDRHAGVIRFLEKGRAALVENLPRITQLRDAIVAGSQTSRWSQALHEETCALYAFYLALFDRLAIPPATQNLLFDRARDIDSNPYCELYQPFLQSVDWSAISVVGITLWAASTLGGLTLARMIRLAQPHVHVVIGGDLFNLLDVDDHDDRQDLQSILTDFADSIVYHEGETALRQLVAAVADQSAFDNIPNLIWLDREELRVNRQYHEDPAALPRFDFDGLPLAYYPGLPIEVSRGCYWLRCTFCRFYRFHQQGGNAAAAAYYRGHSADRIVSDLQYLQQTYGRDFFEFSCLDISPPEMERLCRAIINSGLTIKWGSRLRLDKSFKPELFDIMQQAGCYYYHLYPETFSQKTADLHQKNYDINHIKSLIAYWHDNRHRLAPLLISVFTKFPGETFADFMETYNYIKDASFDVLRLGTFIILKNSGVYFHPEQYGLTPKRVGLRDFVFDHVDFDWNDAHIRERDRITAFLEAQQGDSREQIRQWQKNNWRIKNDLLYD